MRASSSTAFRCWAAAVEAIVGVRARPEQVTRSLCVSRAAGRGFSRWRRSRAGCGDTTEGWARSRKAHVPPIIQNPLCQPLAASACKPLARKRKTPCSRLSTARFANGPKRSMGHVPRAEKVFFLIRGRGRPTVYGGRASGILSIRGPEVSRGSPRVGTIHVQSPTPRASPLQAFLVDFSQQAAEE